MPKEPITPHRLGRRRLLAGAIAAVAVLGTSVSPRASASTMPPQWTPDEIAEQFPPVEDPSRVIPVNGDLAEVVYALGLGDNIVATDLSATFPPEAEATPKIGYQRALSAETILSFEPTVVIADDRAGPAEVFDALRSAGVDVVLVDHHVDLQAPAYKVRAVASALGVADVGEEVVATYERQLAAGQQLAHDAVAESGRPLVLAIYLRGERVQYVFGAGSGIDAVIEAAGGTDVGTELGVADYGELSTEAIIDAAPDYLLVTTLGLGSIGGLDALLEIPGIAETPAGADPENRILQFEDQFLYGLGPRTGQLVSDLAAQLHGIDGVAETTTP